MTPNQFLEQEKTKYEKMWEFDSYRERSPGMRFLDDAIQRVRPKLASTVVDLGCGTGRVSNELHHRGYRVTAVDIAANACKEFEGTFVQSSLWGLPDNMEVFQYGFCFDVMEHLPTEMVDQTISCIAKHTEVCYFQIANFVCHEGDKIGEHLHLTVENSQWWRRKMRKHFRFVEVIEQPKHHIVIARHK